MSRKNSPDYRRPDRAAALRPSVWRERRTVLAAGIILFLVLALALSGRSWPNVAIRLITDGAFLLAWLLAAAGWGSLLPLPRQDDDNRDRCLRCVTTFAGGIGILSLLQLACGLAGLLHRSAVVVMVVVGVALLAFRLRTWTARDLVDWLRAPATWEWLWLATMPVLAMATVAAFVIPGWLWGDEPHGYDVVEYHLQLPREWLELGQIAPLQHNVFSYFPLGMEMHYLLAMQLKGGPWAGMYLAQLMHVAVVALTVLAVYGVARPLATGKLPALLAAIAAANVPWMMLLGPVAYNEGALMLFAALAVGWAMRGAGLNRLPQPDPPEQSGSDSRDVGDATASHDEALQDATAPFGMTGAGRTNSAALRPWLVGGVMAGLACGVKLTAVPLVLLIVPVMVALIAVVRGQGIGRVVAGAAVYVVAGTLIFSPWLIRNTVWTGNPLFPEAQKIFGRAHFSETQSRRWEMAHSPTESQRPIAARMTSAWRQIITDWRFGWFLLPLGGLVAALCWRRPRAWVLLALLAAWLVFWIRFTHLQGRFYVVAIPIAAMALALPRARWQVAVLGTVIALQGALCLWLAGGVFIQRVAPIAQAGLLGAEDLTELMPDDLRSALATRPEAPVALVGDAKAFFYPIPTARLRYRTVFDVDGVDDADTRPGGSILDAWLGEQTGSPIIVINPMELERFSKTYHGIPPLPDDFELPRDRVTVLMPSASRAPPPAPTPPPDPTPPR